MVHLMEGVGGLTGLLPLEVAVWGLVVAALLKQKKFFLCETRSFSNTCLHYLQGYNTTVHRVDSFNSQNNKILFNGNRYKKHKRGGTNSTREMEILGVSYT